MKKLKLILNIFCPIPGPAPHFEKHAYPKSIWNPVLIVTLKTQILYMSVKCPREDGVPTTIVDLQKKCPNRHSCTRTHTHTHTRAVCSLWAKATGTHVERVSEECFVPELSCSISERPHPSSLTHFICRFPSHLNFSSRPYFLHLLICRRTC